VVRVCEPTYKIEELRTEGINVTDLAYDDGTSPPNDVSGFQDGGRRRGARQPRPEVDLMSLIWLQVIEEWFNLLRRRFKDTPDACVAVHCVAGLGRAPVLVALALIELGMKYEDAVEMIRQ